MKKFLFVAFIIALCLSASAVFSLNWTTSLVENTNYPGYSTSLAVDSLGLPHVSYTGTDRILKYASWDGDKWNAIAVGTAPIIGLESALAIDKGGNPNICYMDGTNGKFNYAIWNGSSWNVETIANYYCTDFSLALDSEDEPHIAFRDGSGDPDLRYASRNGSNWEIETIEWALKTGYGASIALDATEKPVITYCDGAPNNGLDIAKWDGSEWHTGAVDHIGGNPVNSYSSLSVGSDGKAYVAYYDTNYADLKFATYQGGMSYIQTVDSEGDVGSYCSMVRDSNGTVHIAYYDATNQRLKYAVSNGSTWDIETTANYCGVGASLKLDSTGNVNISSLKPGTGSNGVLYTTAVVPAEVKITGPTSEDSYSTPQNTIMLSGNASSSVTSISWSCGTKNGVCTLYNRSWWAQVPLDTGNNEITITATKSVGQTATDKIMVTSITGPIVTITSPTSEPGYLTNKVTATLEGTVIGPKNTTKVTWSSTSGKKGTCKGKANWKATGIRLLPGENTITITATDSAKKTGSKEIAVYYMDDVAPLVTIKSPSSKPTYSTTKTSVAISGTASDDSGIQVVLWMNNSTGQAGPCKGTKSWKSTNIGLALGDNMIEAAAMDGADITGSSMVIIKRIDKTKPKVTIQSPTTKSTFKTSTSALSLSGTASDDSALSNITWTNSKGGSGTCQGTNLWSVNGILLVKGSNIITIKATDTSGNFITDKITVTYNP